MLWDLPKLTESELIDLRTGANTQHELIGLLRQSIYGHLAGYEDTDDAEGLSIDPAMRHLIGGGAKDWQAASTNQIGRCQTGISYSEGSKVPKTVVVHLNASFESHTMPTFRRGIIGASP